MESRRRWVSHAGFCKYSVVEIWDDRKADIKTNGCEFNAWTAEVVCWGWHSDLHDILMSEIEGHTTLMPA